MMNLRIPAVHIAPTDYQRAIKTWLYGNKSFASVVILLLKGDPYVASLAQKLDVSPKKVLEAFSGFVRKEI